MPRGCPVLIALALIALAVPVACSPTPGPADPGGPTGTSVTLETVLDPADFPVAIAFAPDGRMFFTEKETGRIRILDADGQLLSEPFADVPVVANSERGLLGITLHPDFADNGYVYAYYTRSSTGEDTRTSSAAQDNRVVRFTAVDDRGTDETLILELPVTPGPNHDGGNIRFGPDGKLYVTLGELADSSNAQRLDVLPGRILRVNDDGSVPEDNPFASDNATYVLGLRNNFDFVFDPLTDVIFTTENGTFLHDEVNRFPAGSNGGWPLVEGSSDGQTVDVEAGTYVDPIVEHDGVVVPTGIDFAPDATFGTDAEHQLFVGEFLTGRVIRYTLNDARDVVTGETIFAQGITGGITDVAFAPDGTLYVLTTTSVLRVVPE